MVGSGSESDPHPGTLLTGMCDEMLLVCMYSKQYLLSPQRFPRLTLRDTDHNSYTQEPWHPTAQGTHTITPQSGVLV